MAVFLRLFGGVFLNDRESLHFRTQATGSLFAFLAYHVGKPHTRDLLVETFWPGRAPLAGRNSLSLALSSLRRLLQNIGVPPNAALLTDRNMVCLSDAYISTDVMIFEALLHAGLWNGAPASGEAQAETQQGQLREAIALYRGPLLESLCDDSEWILGERTRLHGRYEAALHHLARLREAHGDWDDALNLCFQAAQAAPFSEEAQACLIATCLRAGRPSLAVQQYDKYALLLQTESGDTPPEPLQALLVPYRTISGPTAKPLTLSNTGKTKKNAAPGPKHDAAMNHGGSANGGYSAVQTSVFYDAPWGSDANATLPISASLFCGRHQEISHLLSVLPPFSRAANTTAPSSAAAAPRPCRLVVLLGICGIGKTRLAAETVHAGLANVPLAPRKKGQKESDQKCRVFFVPAPNDWGNSAESEVNFFVFVLARTLGISLPTLGTDADAGGNVGRLEDALIKRLQPPTLLVLDAFDAIMAHDENALSALCRVLHRAPHVSCLVTARTRFEVPHDYGMASAAANTTPSGGADRRKSPRRAFGVYEYWVPPLPVPPVPHDEFTPSAPSAVAPPFLFRQSTVSDPNLLTRHYPSAALFAARAQAALERAFLSSPAGFYSTEALGQKLSQSPSFRITAHNCADVAALCAELGGVPLALEIAGAAAAFWSPKEILSRLQTGQAHEAESAALPFPVRGAVQASLALLPADARRLLGVLSVFRGGWTAAAGQCVAALPGTEEMLRLLELLRNAALIVPVASKGKSEGWQAGEKPRWDMLPPVALFVRRHLADGVAAEGGFAAGKTDGFRAWSAAHARYFAHFAEMNSDFWCVEAERENICAAIGWGLEPDTDPCTAREKTEILLRFIRALGSANGESRAACLSSSDEDRGERPNRWVAAHVEYAAQRLVQPFPNGTTAAVNYPPHVWLMASRCAFGRGDFAQAIPWADQAIRLGQHDHEPDKNGPSTIHALSRAYRGFLACWTGDTATARTLLGGGKGTTLSRPFFQSLTALWDGDYVAARFFANQCLAATRHHTQGQAVSAGAFFVLASIAVVESPNDADKYREAQIYLDESLSRWGFGSTALGDATAVCGATRFGDTRLACLALSLRGWLGMLATDAHNSEMLQQAVRSHWRAFCLSQRIGCEENRVVALEGLGQAAWYVADAANAFAAIRLWGAAHQIRQKSGIPLRLPPVLREKAKKIRVHAREQVGGAVYDAQHFIGTVLTETEVARLVETVCLPHLEEA